MGELVLGLHYPSTNGAPVRAEIGAELERTGKVIRPHDLQIASIAVQHRLTLLTHNTERYALLLQVRDHHHIPGTYAPRD